MGSCQSLHTGEGKSDYKQKAKPQIMIKSFTWTRDSHGLFDYESKTLTKKNMKSSHEGKLVRKANDVILNKENDAVNSGDKELLRMNIRDGNYWVGSCIDSVNKKASKDGGQPEYDNNDHSVWLVVKSFKPAGSSKNGFKLSEGDLLKLGRIKFRVKELRSSGAATTTNKKVQQIEKLEKQTKIEEDNNGHMGDSPRRSSKVSVAGSRPGTAQQTCRICLGEQTESDDPFFSPCNCSGTMKYIHVTCLQRWLKSKLIVKQTEFSSSVYWKSLECELCKTTYPNSFEVQGKKYDIVEVDRPDCPYLMLEILSKEKNIQRGIHVLKMENKNTIRLGRGHDSDIRITDISVSRCHAMLKFDKGNYYLEDNSSKFGTLIHLKKPFPLFGDYNNISLQIGRTVLTLSVKKNWKALPGCFGGDRVKSPIEIDDNDLFGKSPIQHQDSESNVILNRGPSVFEDNHIGPFDDANANGEGGNLPSPIHQEEDMNLDEDNLSDISNQDEQQDEQQGEQQDEQQNPANVSANSANAQIAQGQADQIVENQVVENQVHEELLEVVQGNGQPQEQI